MMLKTKPQSSRLYINRLLKHNQVNWIVIPLHSFMPVISFKTGIIIKCAFHMQRRIVGRNS